jgi:hypothetical protein
MTMSAAAAMADARGWSTHASARTKRQAKQASTNKQQDNRKNLQKNDFHTKNQQKKTKNNFETRRTPNDRDFPRYEHDATIRSIIHQLHTQVYQEAPVDLIIDVFMKLRNAAKHKLKYPFRLEEWHFPYSMNEKKEMEQMSNEDTYEAENTYENESTWDLANEDTKFRLLAAIRHWIYEAKLPKELLARKARLLTLEKELIEPTIREPRNPTEVPHNPPPNASSERIRQLQPWKNYCIEARSEVSKHRSMTTEETDIMNAILTLSFPIFNLKFV